MNRRSGFEGSVDDHTIKYASVVCKKKRSSSVKVEAFGRSLIYKVKRSRPGMDPSGTPHLYFGNFSMRLRIEETFLSKDN